MGIFEVSQTYQTLLHILWLVHLRKLKKKLNHKI
jgi:hypothetical protein